MPVVLGEEAEGHRGDWVVAPGAVQAAEQVLALLRGERCKQLIEPPLLPRGCTAQTQGPSQSAREPSWERAVTKETLTAPPQTLSLLSVPQSHVVMAVRACCLGVSLSFVLVFLPSANNSYRPLHSPWSPSLWGWEGV